MLYIQHLEHWEETQIKRQLNTISYAKKNKTGDESYSAVREMNKQFCLLKDSSIVSILNVAADL